MLNIIEYKVTDYHIEFMFKATQERYRDLMCMRRFKRSHYKTINELLEQLRKR